MGGGQDTSQTHTSRPGIPKFLLPLLQNTANNWLGAQGGLPGIQDLYNNVPLLNVPGLTNDQMSSIGQIEKQGQNPGQLTPDELAAQGGFQRFLSDKGPSDATQAGMKQFNDFAAPTINQQSALMGRGNSGAALSALAQGQEQAAVPFLLADEQNRMAASNGMANLGQTQADRIRSDQLMGLEAAGMPRDVQMQQNQAKFNQQGQKFNLAQQIQMGLANLFGSTMGGGNTTTTGSQSKF